jgi:alkanesulfonate monooxygenase SsuD/methylene tetrahydromethanopterin reductase-like flavin-dependent oxidoreductase (luciferase family)
VRRDIPVWIGGNGPRSIERVIELGDGWHPVGMDMHDFQRGAEKVRRKKKDATLSIRMTTDVRKKRETYVGANKEKRVAVSGTSAEIRKQIDSYAAAGLEYYCASINHPVAAEIIADLRRFSSEVVKSYG